jgi:hypothetical protein
MTPEEIKVVRLALLEKLFRTPNEEAQQFIREILRKIK